MTLGLPMTLAIVAAIAAATAFTRFAPFWLLPKDKPLPSWAAYLAKVLPPAVMGLLVVYCLKDVSFTASPFGLPELLCIALVAGLYAWKRSMLLSIGGGTAAYMLVLYFL